MARIELATAPGSDEIEVSLFGPGYGESVAVHLGLGEWLVVDSCIHRNGESAPLAYLHQIGVRVGEQVRLILASHWHDDHIRGLAQLVEECTAAKFFCSTAMKSDEFFAAVDLYSKRSMAQRSGVAEFRRIIGALDGRAVPPGWAVADRRLYERYHLSGEHEVEVYSLSPSDQAVWNSFQTWAGLLAVEDSPMRRAPSQFPNHAAVVLWIRVGTRIAILGADLEEVGNPGGGWSAILASVGRPRDLASLFKVAHHGSAGADHAGVWSDLLTPDRVAILSPFTNGRIRLPGREDARRILQQAPDSYLTAPPRLGSRRSGGGPVARTIRETTRDFHDGRQQVGQVRMRSWLDANQPDEWRVELFGPAQHLSAIA